MIDIFQLKYKSLFGKNLLNIVNLIKFNNNYVELKGSSLSLWAKKYLIDYNFISKGY